MKKFLKSFVIITALFVVISLCACSDTGSGGNEADKGQSTSENPVAGVENNEPAISDASSSTLELVTWAQNLEELCCYPDVKVIARGKVKSIQAIFARPVCTYVTIDVTEVLKGEVNDGTLSFLEMGGHINSSQAKEYFAGKGGDYDFPDGFTFESASYAVSQVGDEVLVFLENTDNPLQTFSGEEFNADYFVAYAVQGKFIKQDGIWRCATQGEYELQPDKTEEAFFEHIKKSIK